MHANKISEAKQNETKFLITNRIKNQATRLENIPVKHYRYLIFLILIKK